MALRLNGRSRNREEFNKTTMMMMMGDADKLMCVTKVQAVVD
jgi:hypothetical protein